MSEKTQAGTVTSAVKVDSVTAGQESNASPSQRLGQDILALIPDDFASVVDFHGHLCPGVTIGYRAALIAMNRLGVVSAVDEELIGIVETDACGVDAFQMLTGCTMGKGNLVFRDYGKQAFTLVRRATGQGVRVALNPDALHRDPGYAELRVRVMTGQASAPERASFAARHIDVALGLLDITEREFANVTMGDIDLPDKARVFPSVICSVCGETVMEPRARIQSGEPICIPCSDRYGRGWEVNE